MLNVKNVRKSYYIDKKHKEEVLKGVNFNIQAGEFVALVGPSGSGKSTLLNIISGLDNDYEGEVYYNGLLLNELDNDLFHRDKIGFIFQSFNLIPHLTIVENVMLTLDLVSEYKNKDKRQQAEKLLIQVGLGEYLKKRPTQLSGGQKQRVAIARALANNPDVIIADEPTGALDSKTSQEIILLLKNLAEQGHTVIVVTHDPHVASQANRKISIRDGIIVEDWDDQNAHTPIQKTGTDTKRSKLRFSALQSVKLAFNNFHTRLTRNILVALGMSIGITAILIAMGLGNGVGNNMANMFNSQFAPTQISAFYISNSRGGVQRPTEILSEEERQRLVELFESEGLTEIYQNQILHGVGFLFEDEPLLDNQLYTLQEAGYKPERYTQLQVSEGGLINGALFGGEDGVLLPEHVAQEILDVSELTIENSQPLIGKAITLVFNNRETGHVVEYSAPISGITSASVEGFSGSVMVSPLTMAGILEQAEMEPQILSVEAFASSIEEAQSIIEKYTENPDWKDYSIANANTFIDTFQQYIQMIVVLIAAVAGLSLLVSGVMIAIVLFISVIERTKEIGIMRAVGYRKHYVQRLFIQEASFTVVASNILSVALAFVVSFIANPILANQIGFDSPIAISFVNVITTFAITLGIGILFALYPSLRASRQDPVVALRSE